MAGQPWRNKLAGMLARFIHTAPPPYSTLKGVEIKDVATTTMGSGIALVYKKDGKRKLVLLQAGPHYPSYDASKPAYMIPGGFVNLAHTEGSTLVAASDKPESVFAAAARELEEEMPLPDGRPLLVADPARLHIIDNVPLRFKSGETRQVFGLLYELAADEITAVETYVERMTSDPAYLQAVMAHTVNPYSKRPEMCGIRIFDLDDAAAGKIPLLHADQQSLFVKA
ncbi:MAG: hypothetical protein JO126_01065, partial [Alphaproteobacteria bacterium]|nr:hypothetical protein [Alphaproteobacteria bacterium]